MAKTRCGKGWMWRWRRNPLRRRSDVVDAWIVLAAWLIALCGGVLTGLAAGSAVDHGLDRQRAERHPVSSVLTENAPGRTSASALDGSHVWAIVRWTAPDGSTHTGRAKVHPGAKAGTLATVWVDRQGRLTSKPLAHGEASFQAAWTGVLVGLGVAGALLGGAQLVRLRLARRQSRQWDEEWARVDTPWGWKAG
jgi:F0F1-type ATP synthase membrane subunit c/vacuolar-type H+-ATPase subunit K